MGKEFKKALTVEMWSGFFLILIICIFNIAYFWNELKYFENLKKKI